MNFRDQKITELSQMIVDGNIVHKIDHIATVYINNIPFYNVYRRYNSPYNIVIEDMAGELHLHQDYTIRKSLQQLLALDSINTSFIYMERGISYKHNGPIQRDMTDMRWSEIHSTYHSVFVNFVYTYDNISNISNIAKEEVPSTPRNQTIIPKVEPPKLQKREKTNIIFTTGEIDAANTLLSISIPKYDYIMSESDFPEMSMKNEDIKKRYPLQPLPCRSYDSSDDEIEENNSTTDSDYTVLRNGTKILKRQ
jgi:hypothetical protein